MSSHQFHIPIPTDTEGMLGRECPGCERYFKLRPGTGLPIETCRCPYCGHHGQQSDFGTREQLDYAKSIALNEIQHKIIGPEVRKLGQSLERASRDSFITMKMDYRPTRVPISAYEERTVQTDVTCDACGLQFAIFGVFATCPDCGQLNALRVFNESLRAVDRRLALLDTSHGVDLTEEILDDALDGAVSAFDGFGKELRRRFPGALPDRPQNLFQNLPLLSTELARTGDSLAEIVGESEYRFLVKMFNVRHIYEHNMGVVDDSFCRRVSATDHLLGQKYELRRGGVHDFLNVLGSLPEVLLSRLSQ